MSGAQSRRRGADAERQHGKRTTYRKGCRCEECRAANSAAEVARKRRKGVLPFDEAMAARWASVPRCAASTCGRTVPAAGELCEPCARRAKRTGDPDVPVTEMDPKARILRRKTDVGGCWVWTGAVGNNGYGRMGAHGKLYQAHRYSYEAFVGPIPKGLHIDHLCRNKLCVNPAHLEPVTQAENNRRANAVRWAR